MLLVRPLEEGRWRWSLRLGLRPRSLRRGRWYLWRGQDERSSTNVIEATFGFSYWQGREVLL